MVGGGRRRQEAAGGGLGGGNVKVTFEYKLDSKEGPSCLKFYNK